MPGMPYDRFVDALRQAWPQDFQGRTPKQVVEDLLVDYPDLETVLDPSTRFVLDDVGVMEKESARVAGISGPLRYNTPLRVDPVKEQAGRRPPTYGEQAAGMALRIAPALGGAMLGGPGGGFGGAMAGEAVAEGLEDLVGIGSPPSHANILAQSALGAVPFTKFIPGVNRLGTTVGQRIVRSGIEGTVQGAAGTEAEYRLREDRPPTMVERGIGTLAGGVVGSAMGGGAEAIRAYRQVQAQGRMTRGQTAAIEAVIGDYDMAQQAGMLDRQTRESQLPFLTKLFGQIQDPMLRQSAAERMERIFLAAHQNDLRQISAKWTADFQKQAPEMPLHERLKVAQAFTEFLHQSAAERETIEQVATILAGVTTGPEPKMRLGLPAPSGEPTGVKQGPFYGTPPDGPPFLNQPDSELVPPGRMLPPGPPEPPPLSIQRVGDSLEQALQKPPGPPRLKRIDPGAGVLRRERLPVPAPFQPPLKGLGKLRPKLGPPGLGDAPMPGPLGRQFAPQGLETIPRVASGELSPDDALFLHFIKADIDASRQVQSGGIAHNQQSHAARGVIAHGGPATVDNTQVLNAIERLLTTPKGKLSKTQQALLSYARALQRIYDPVDGFPKQPRLGRYDEQLGKFRDYYDDSVVVEDEPLHHARHDQWNADYKKTPHLEFVPGIEHALADEDWGRQRRGLADRWVPHLLAPEEIYPAFAPNPRTMPPDVAKEQRGLSDEALIDQYTQALEFGGVEAGRVGWLMSEIEARGLREFRQPGLQTEGPGSPARRNLPREIAEQPGLFEEPLPENPTPELTPPEFSLTPEVSQRTAAQPSLLPSEPPKFGDPRAEYEKAAAMEILAEQAPGAFKPDKPGNRPSYSGPEPFPSIFDETGAVGKVGLPKPRREGRAPRQLVLQNEAYGKLIQVAKAGAGREVAGVLLGYADGGIAQVVPAKNVHPDPTTGFEIAEPELRAIVRRARAQGLEVLATYHTQPTGSAAPSKADMRGSVADIPLVILGMDGGDVIDARVWQPGRNRQWAEGSLGVAQVKDPLTPPVFQDIKDVKRFVRAVPRLRAAPGDTVGIRQWLDKNRSKYDGQAWFVDAERLMDAGQHREAWLQIQTMQLLGEKVARAGATKLSDPVQSKQAIELVESLARGGAQDPVGTMFALYDGRTTTIPGVGRVVVPPVIPPNLKGTDVFAGPGGIIRPGERTGKLYGSLTDGTLATKITQQFLEGADPSLILDDPSKVTDTRLFRQITEQFLLSPANFKALKALTDSGEITVEAIAQQYQHAISESARQLAALSVWKRQHRAEIRSVEGIRGAAGDVQDLVIRGHGNRVIGKLGDLTAQETFQDLVKPTRAWDQVMLVNDLTRQKAGTFSQLESASRAFMISQLATAQRNLLSAGIRSFPEAFDLMMEGVAHTMAGNPGKAQAAFTRAAERAKIPYYLSQDGLWVSPWRARQAEFSAIYNGASGSSKQLLDLATALDPTSAHLLGGVAFGEPTPHGKSKWGIINALTSPKLQNTLTMFNRAQEFTVRGNIYAAEMRAGLRNAGIDLSRLDGMSPAAIADAVGGQEKLQQIFDTAVHQALNFSFAGDLIRKGFGKDDAGRAIGSIPAAVVDILNRFPVIRAGYPFPRFNLSAAPRFLWDHSLIGLALDPLYAKTFQRGRFFLGQKAQAAMDTAIPEAERGIAAAQRDLGNALLSRMTLQRRLQTYQRMVGRSERQLAKAIDAAGAQPEIAGLADRVRSSQKSLDLLRAERNSLQAQLQKTIEMKDRAQTRLKDWESQKQALQGTVDEAIKADAPRSWEQLIARNLFGGGALLGAAWMVRSLEGAEGTPWYVLKIDKPFGQPGEKVELDFRPFAPFAQYLFAADLLKDVYEYTDWTGVWEDLETGDLNDIADAIYQRYEGKYTAQTLGREIGNAFLSMSQVAGTTLALADMILEVPTQGVPSPQGYAQNALRVVGSFFARFTIPFAQVKAVTDLVDDDESKARIAKQDKTQGLSGLAAPLMQPVGNLPFLGAILIPETVNQITGKPLDTYAPLMRALTGVTMRERTELQDVLTESGLPGASIYLRDTGDPFLDRLLGFHYSNILNRVLPQILDDPDWQRLPTPALRRDYLQKLLPRLKKAAIGQALEDSDPESLQSAREGREGRRRRLRMERLERLIDQEQLRDLAPVDEEPEPDAAPEPAPQTDPNAPPLLGQAWGGGRLPSEPPRLGG